MPTLGTDGSQLLSIPGAMQEASLEEGPVLRLILDYFERAGHGECLVPLENYCRRRWNNANEKILESFFPSELAALRELSLQGKWEQVVQYLNAFSGCSDKEGLERCMYLAERQKYFEILHHIENSIRSKFRLGYSLPGNSELLSPKEIERTKNLIQHQLSVLEGLSPSVEEFHLLKHLYCSSSLSSSKDFATWELHSGRLETFYRIGEWVSKILYLTVTFPEKLRNKRNLVEADSCTLLRLIAKGLMYEQCEQLCRLRCGEGGMEEPSKLLDLSSWMQQQPDSSFQTFPSAIVLVVKPIRSKIDSKQQVQEATQESSSPERAHASKDCRDGDKDDAQNAELINNIVDTVAARAASGDVANEDLQQKEVNAAESTDLATDDHSENRQNQASVTPPPSISSPDHRALSGSGIQPVLSPGTRRSSTPRNCKTSLVSLQESLLSSPIAPCTACTSQPDVVHSDTAGAGAVLGVKPGSISTPSSSTGRATTSVNQAIKPSRLLAASPASNTSQSNQAMDPDVHERTDLQIVRQRDGVTVEDISHKTNKYTGWHQQSKTSSSQPHPIVSILKENREPVIDSNPRVSSMGAPAWPTSATLLGTLSDSQVSTSSLGGLMCGSEVNII